MHRGRGYSQRGQGRNYDRDQSTYHNRSYSFANNWKGDREQNKVFCTHYTLFDHCRFGKSCTNIHAFRRIAHISDAVKSGISCIGFTKFGGFIQVFTSSHYPPVKKWKITESSNGRVHLDGDGILNISMLDTRGNRRSGGKKIASMQCINECLFLGLDDGQICVTHLNTGSSTMIKAHQAPVKDIILIDSVVVTACSEGKINLWSFDLSSGCFNPINTLLLNTPLLCLIEISAIHMNTEIRTLWAGGENSISIIDLKTLTLISTLQQKSKVQSIIRYREFVIVGLYDGTVNAYDLVGNIVFSTTINPISSMDIMQVNNEDLLIIGTRMGSILVRRLPSFEDAGMLGCHWEKVVTKVYNLGLNYFATAGMDGALSIFHWDAI